MTLSAAELIRKGEKDQVWTKYCGFLDLNLDEFMIIQERLLKEQISLLSQNGLGKILWGNRAPATVEEFRRRVPITCYDDYAHLLDKKNELYKDAYVWAHTSGRSGGFKWVPYTELAYKRLGERVLAGVILGAAKSKGEVNIKPGDVLVYNTPARPYISGVALRALADEFEFNFVPALEETESMEFQERIAKGFQIGLETGIDILGSMSSVLVKMGERFAEGAQTVKISSQMLKPKVFFRLLRGYLRARMENRKMLPRDLWKIKVLPCGGADTTLYKDKIAHYWGVQPYESYGCTEEGAVATQGWNQKYMTFFPDAAFYEFIPEEEWYKWHQDSTYVPKTVLFNEVKPNKRYEMVMTNFYGKPLLRYRTYDLIEFPVMQDKETGVNLPQMSFVGRSADFIDLAGFTGLIDERMVWHAITNSGIQYNDWSIRKEIVDGEPVLQLYMEPSESLDQETIRSRVHEALKGVNPFYADYETMMEKPALAVTVLRPGTFQDFMLQKQAAGADLAHLKPPRMNPSDDMVDLLLKLDEGKKVKPERQRVT